MDGMTVADAQGVVAPINFIEPMTEKPYSYNYEPPPGVPPRNTREETHHDQDHRRAPVQRHAVLGARGVRPAAPPDRGDRPL